MYQTLHFSFSQYVYINGIVMAFILRIVLAGDIENIEGQEDAAEILKIHFICRRDPETAALHMRWIFFLDFFDQREYDCINFTDSYIEEVGHLWII